MNMDMYGHATSANAGVLRNLKQSLTSVTYSSRSRSKDGSEKRFQFKSTKMYIYAIVLTMTSTYELGAFVTSARKFQGAAFIIPFTLLYILMGLPVLLSQIFFGHFARSSILKVWRLSPIAIGIGYSMLVLSVLKVIGNGMFMSMNLVHIPWAMQPLLPWSHCDRLAGNPICVDEDNDPHNFSGSLAEKKCCASHFDSFDNCFEEQRDPLPYASLLWHNSKEFLGTSDPDNRTIQEFNLKFAAASVVIWMTICLVLQRKLRSFSTMLIPLGNIIMVLFLILLITVFFESSMNTLDGISFMVVLRIDDFQMKDLWDDCYKHAFESLHLIYGTHLLYSSFAPKSDNATSTTVFLATIKYIVLILFTLMYAAMFGVVAFKLEAPSPRCIQAEVWSALMVVPGQFFGMMANGAIWNVVFFSTLFLIDLVYMILLLFSVLESVWDWWPKTRKYRMHTSVGLCTLGFLLGLPFMTEAGSLLYDTLLGHIIPHAGLMLITLYTIIVMWVYGVTRLSDDIHFTTGKAPTQSWTVIWYLLPIPLLGFGMPFSMFELTTVLNENHYYVVLLLALFILSPVLVLAIYQSMVFFRAKNLYQVFFPAATWGPPDQEDKRHRLHFNPRKIFRFSVDAPLKFRPVGLIGRRRLKVESDRLESHRKIYLETLRSRHEEDIAEREAAAGKAPFNRWSS